jgi:hypothetical protein
MSYPRAKDEQHTTPHTGKPSRASPRRSRLRQATAIAAALAGVVLLAAACSDGTASTTATSAAQGGSTATNNADEIPYTLCMRAHGVPNFPDPNAQGKPFTAENLQQAGLDPDSPEVESAMGACAHLLVPPSPAQVAQQTAELVRYAACMRAHGLPDFPDPSISSTGGASLGLTPGILDSPEFQPAEQACHSADPGLPIPTRTSKGLPDSDGGS